MSQSVPFRFPTQDPSDVELVVEVPVRAGLSVAGTFEAEAQYGSPHPKSPEHRLVSQEPVPGRSGAITMRRVYRRLPGTALVGEALRSTNWGAVTSTSSQEVPVGTAADTGLNVLESVVEPKDAQVSRKKTTSVEEWPVLTERSVESQTGTPLTTTHTMVAAGSALPDASPLTLERKLSAVNKWRSIQIVTSLDALPASYVEYREKSVRFPGLFYGYDTDMGISKRVAFSRTVAARVEVSFSESPVEPDLYLINMVQWNYPGTFDCSDVLTNGETVVYAYDSNILSLTVPKSTPTRSDYEALIGGYVTLYGSCERWKGNIWRTELWKIRLA